MEAWAKRLREAPYPGGTLGVMALESFATLSWVTALIAVPFMLWFERRPKVKVGNVS
ncbi:hypothetical protein SAMN05421819_1074 [Bryocella elongata]|uniref:Uncharacterized protein n=1 Tax=Bryocella elongata TaxID=863522 RepID=A0A1H5UL21_9BACT|nr:hypothetical protein SAMN05421819_1074 [Bryocella elongata]